MTLRAPRAFNVSDWDWSLVGQHADSVGKTVNDGDVAVSQDRPSLHRSLGRASSLIKLMMTGVVGNVSRL